MTGTTGAPRSGFWRYWTALTVSSAGTAVTTLALPLVAVTTLDASPLEVSLLIASSYAAWAIVGLPAGVIVQRWPLRATQIAMDAVRAAALVSIPAALALDALTLAHLYVVALVVSLASVIYSVANSTFLPSLVSKEELASRNSFVSASDATVQLTGPPVGGILVQSVGAATALLVDAVSYVVSALVMQTVRRPVDDTGNRSSSSETVRARIAAGMAFVWRHPVMRPCVMAAAAINFACGALLAITPVYIVSVLGASPFALGLVLSSEAIGSLIGAAITTRLVSMFGTTHTLSVAMVVAAASFAILPLGSGPAAIPVFALGSAGFAFGVVVFSITTRTHRQSVTPRDFLSRVMATVRFLSWGVVPLGAVTIGVLAELVGVRLALAAIVPSLLVALLLTRVRPLRGLRNLDDYEDTKESAATYA